MDVPEFNDELVDLIATQSDDQSDKWSIRELEKIRDDNLVAIMEALGRQNKGKGWGAGELYNDYTKQLSKLASKKKPELKSKTAKSSAKAKAEKPVKKAVAKATKKAAPNKAGRKKG
jgi:carnitine 3-dehydrogenase